MLTQIQNSDPSQAHLDAILLVCPSFEKTSDIWSALPKSLSEIGRISAETARFKGEAGSTVLLPTLGKIKPRWLVLAGVGKNQEAHAILRSVGKAVRLAHQQKVVSLGVFQIKARISADLLMTAIEQADYEFGAYSAKPSEKKATIEKIQFFSPEFSQEELNSATIIAKAVRYTKHLANQPPNVFSPAVLALEAQKMSKEHGIKCEVWDEKRLKKEGFGGILAVGQGSQNPPRFIRMDYRGASSKEAPYVVIGKAITFDTGGISIKPGDKMDEMKFDKCGGIATLGIMAAIAELKLPINVTGLVASAENMPSGSAYRPGDLVKMLSGKHVEVLNTDAEGRVVLADAVTYACRQLKPKAMVDMATLTGACIICLGHEAAAVLGNQQQLVDELQKASQQSGQRLWQLPLWKEFQDMVKSDVAYVKNTAGRAGGTITGACFIHAFVENDIPWAHLDIAGTAWTDHDEPHRGKGATAYGVRLILEWLARKK